MAKKRTILKTYKSYSFIDKDPVIDSLRTIVSDSHKKYSTIKADSGVSTTTLHNWFHGKTRRPQFATVSAVAKACGATGIQYNGNKPRFTRGS